MRRFLWISLATSAVGAASAMGACSDLPDYPLLDDSCDGGDLSCVPTTAAANVGVGVSASATSSSSGSSSSTASSSVASSSGSTASTSSSSSSSSSGAGGASATSDLAGTVARMTDPSFTSVGASFTGALTIEVLPSSGTQVDASYGGDAGAEFDATGVAAGQAWVVALDDSSGASGVWSTATSLTTPQIAPVTLPVVDATMLGGIASSLPSVSASGLSKTAAQIVIRVSHAAQPYAGVTVSGSAGGAVVAYDTGSGTYSDTATSTGPAGTILLLNTSLSGMTSISLTPPGTATATSVPILAGASVVTLVTVDL